MRCNVNKGKGEGRDALLGGDFRPRHSPYTPLHSALPPREKVLPPPLPLLSRVGINIVQSLKRKVAPAF